MGLQWLPRLLYPDAFDDSIEDVTRATSTPCTTTPSPTPSSPTSSRTPSRRRKSSTRCHVEGFHRVSSGPSYAHVLLMNIGNALDASTAEAKVKRLRHPLGNGIVSLWSCSTLLLKLMAAMETVSGTHVMQVSEVVGILGSLLRLIGPAAKLGELGMELIQLGLGSLLDLRELVHLSFDERNHGVSIFNTLALVAHETLFPAPPGSSGDCVCCDMYGGAARGLDLGHMAIRASEAHLLVVAVLEELHFGTGIRQI